MHTDVIVESSLQLFFVIDSWCNGFESRLLGCNNITSMDNCSSDLVTLNCQGDAYLLLVEVHWSYIYYYGIK